MSLAGLDIIFLDFDGVLNSIQSVSRSRRINGPPQYLLFRKEDFCPIATSNLKKLLEVVPTARIVVSSTWRRNNSMEFLQDTLEEAGIPRSAVIDTTPSYSPKGNERGHEIQDWLDKHPEVTNFVIIDDDNTMLHLEERLVHTSFMHGFMWGDLIAALRILGYNHELLGKWAGICNMEE